MVDAHVDVTVQDKYKCNFVHALIVAAAEYRELEPKYMEIYTAVMSNLDVTRKRQVLYEQDEDRFRPLELAAKRGLYGLFRLILDTKGVYLQERIVARQGLHNVVRYNLSEYEDHGSRYRQLRHPLRMIHFLKTSHVNSYLANNIHNSPAVEAWRTRKSKQFFPYVLIWFSLRFLFLVLITYYGFADFSSASAKNYGDDSKCLPLSPSDMHSLGLFLAVISFFMILFDILEFVFDSWDKDRKIVDRVYEIKDLFVTHTKFYRYGNFILCCLCITQYFLAQFRVIKSVYLSAKAVTLVFTLFSFLQILELLPWISTVAMFIQRILVLFLHFVGIQTGFRVVFYLFLRGTGTDLAKDKGDFKLFGGGIYALFRLDKGGGGSFGTNPPGYLQFTHHILYTVFSVIFINMLVTVMVDCLTQMTKFKHLIRSLRRLEMIILFEERCAKFCTPFCRRFPREIVSPFRIDVTRTAMHLDEVS
jgi:hypothetical protein